MSFKKYIEDSRLNEGQELPTQNQVREMVALHMQLEKVVKDIWDLYEDADFNQIQPREMKDVYAASLDDWWSDIRRGISAWKKIYTRGPWKK